MLDTAIELQKNVTWYISENANYIDKNDQIIIQDWSYLYTMHTFLSAFVSATLKFKKSYGTLEKVLHIIGVLNTVINKTLVCRMILFLSSFY